MILIDLDNPTSPHSYVQRGSIKGTPMYWQDDVTGKMQEVVKAHLDQNPTPDQLKIMIAYLQHFIHAPCWLEQSPSFGKIDPEIADKIRTLREQSLGLKSLDDVNQFINSAMEIAIDPL